MIKKTKTEKTEKKQKYWLYKKGQSGNPNGRPKGSVSIVEGIKRKLLEIEPINRKTYLELFLSKLFLKAIKEGNEKLMMDIIDRVDGKALQRVEGKMMNISEELDNLESDYGEVAKKAEAKLNNDRQEIKKQVVENKPPIQDKRQIGEADNIQTEQDTTKTSS